MDRQALLDAFDKTFGGQPDIVTVAPGRINLIGEHTDYNDGFVFPAAIDRGLYVAARVKGGQTSLYSEQLGRATAYDARAVLPGQLTDWGRYVAGMAWILQDRGAIPNVEAVVHSEVPIGSGVSSSAALEMAFGVLYDSIAGLGISNKEMALLAQKDENQFVGVTTGIMDQMASAMGRAGHAMFLDTRTLDIVYARIPDDVAIVLCDTKTPRALTSSAYNERRSQCEAAARVLGVRALRDATLESLELHRNLMEPIQYCRARHVVTENARCQLFIEALNTNQRGLMGQLMQESHVSLRDDYEVSSRELNLMAEACWDTPGCIGARMTGAGFGGACVALVEESHVVSFADKVNIAYENASGIVGEILTCRAVDGARVI